MHLLRIPFAGKLAALLLTFCCLSAQAADDRSIVEQRIQAMNGKLANEHPRLLIRPADIPALRKSLLETLPAQPDTAALAKLALAPLDNKPLPPQPLAVSNGTDEGSKAWREGYQTASDTGNQAWRYALGWQLKNDAQYGREAARWLLHLASWKIDREVLRTNDELFIQHLRPMIFAYDWAYDALTPEERTTVRTALEARLKLLAEHIQPKFSLTQPTSPDNSLSHPMRFISTLGLGGLALYHDTPAAPGWVAWAYEYYNRQFPVWGGDAGGWAEGLNYWATGMTQHMRFLEAMQLQGFDEPLARPFFRNTPWFATYFQMPYGGSSFGDLTNIMAPTPSMALLLEKFALLQQDPYLLQAGRLFSSKLPTAFNYYDYGAIDALLHLFRRGQSKLVEAELYQLPRARLFDDIGWVAMHGKLGDKATDVMMGFKSSPFGSASHSFADQNSFVINAFGEPLAISSGYREYYDSPHHKGWTRTTAAKNAILVGGEGQPIKQASAKGRIARFLAGDQATYVLGDAREAYAGKLSQALRHVLFVDKRYWVMLDELAADEARNFQWLLHAREKMQIDESRNFVQIAKGAARLDVYFLSPALGQLAFRQTNQFAVPVANGYEKRMPDEWHMTAETKKEARSQSILSVLFPRRDGYTGDEASVRALPARSGFAAAVTHDAGVDRIYIARDKDRSIRADGINADARAAWLGERGEDTRLLLVDVRRFNEKKVFFEASKTLSMEGYFNWSVFNVRFLEPPPEGTTIQFRIGLPPRTLTGVPKNDWIYDEDNKTLDIKLRPSTSLLRIVPARPFDEEENPNPLLR
ncbi:heparinase II/III domain-containing protein [Viridibacterium curvum]|uniref:DUF4962 domain-containing protein n=1 Tax=Viridibacterium curvum TaxID=1101404 RepID=A0ABP9QXN6_9RHOO